jgi:hypothetical protein
LRETIDLVVMATVREGQQFRFELGQEWSAGWKPHPTGREFTLLHVKTADFVVLDLNQVLAA